MLLWVNSPNKAAAAIEATGGTSHLAIAEFARYQLDLREENGADRDAKRAGEVKTDVLPGNAERQFG